MNEYSDMNSHIKHNIVKNNISKNELGSNQNTDILKRKRLTNPEEPEEIDSQQNYLTEENKMDFNEDNSDLKIKDKTNKLSEDQQLNLEKLLNENDLFAQDVDEDEMSNDEGIELDSIESLEEFREIMNLVDNEEKVDDVQELNIDKDNEVQEVNKDNLYIQNIEKLTKYPGVKYYRINN